MYDYLHGDAAVSTIISSTSNIFVGKIRFRSSVFSSRNFQELESGSGDTISNGVPSADAHPFVLADVEACSVAVP